MIRNVTIVIGLVVIGCLALGGISWWLDDEEAPAVAVVEDDEPTWLLCPPDAPSVGGVRTFTGVAMNSRLGVETIEVRGAGSRPFCTYVQDRGDFEIAREAWRTDEATPRCGEGDRVDDTLSPKWLCVGSAGNPISTRSLDLNTDWTMPTGHAGVSARCCKGGADQACQNANQEVASK